LAVAHKGYLVISDITGYTGFLNQSELEHAEDSLRTLLELLIDHNGPPLIISRLEGDAVISYAPLSSVLQGPTLVDMIESTYGAFKKALENMVVNTTCSCKACRNLPNLDLKFFVHFGEFVIQRLASYDELIGNDVNLLHRLVKNHITERTSLRAYAAYSAAALEALGVGGMYTSLIAHTESYEHIGTVQIYVQDMWAVWKKKQDELRIFADPKESAFVVEQDFPLPASLLWDYLTKPEYRSILQGSDWQKLIKAANGRTSRGAVYHCAHGKRIFVQTIIDWQPFEYYTIEEEAGMPGTSFLFTYRLVPTPQGARLMAISGRSRGPLFLRQLNDFFARFTATRLYASGTLALYQQILDDMAEEKRSAC
jgi:Protein of unknown function (DUF2652)